MAALFLIEDHVRELLDMPTAIEVVEELFRELANGRARRNKRQRNKRWQERIALNESASHWLKTVWTKNASLAMNGMVVT